MPHIYFCYISNHKTNCTRNSDYNFKILQLMWSMEYNPSLFSMLESDTGTSGANSKDENVLKQCGNFERKNLQVTKKDEIPLSVFIVASVLEIKNKRLLSEAKGLDDVVKVSLSLTHTHTHSCSDDDDCNFLLCICIPL
jgi:hypothetical protein